MDFDKLLLFFFMVFFTVFIFKIEPTVTGMAIGFNDVREKVEELAAVTPFLLVAEDANICVYVETDNNLYPFHVTRTSVTDGCTGDEDFIIKYPSYDALIKSIGTSTCTNFVEGLTGKLYYFLPSKYVKKGGIVLCDADFERRYCAIAKVCLKQSEMEFMAMDCCFDYEFSAAQRALLQGYIEETEARNAFTRKELFKVF